MYYRPTGEEVVNLQIQGKKVIVPDDLAAEADSKLKELRTKFEDLPFKTKFVKSLQYVWKYPFKCLETGITWTDDLRYILINSTVFSDFLKIKTNSLNKNLIMYNIELVKTVVNQNLNKTRKWKCRESKRFKITPFTTDRDLETFKPTSFSQQLELKVERFKTIINSQKITELGKHQNQELIRSFAENISPNSSPSMTKTLNDVGITIRQSSNLNDSEENFGPAEQDSIIDQPIYEIDYPIDIDEMPISIPMEPAPFQENFYQSLFEEPLPTDMSLLTKGETYISEPIKTKTISDFLQRNTSKNNVKKMFRDELNRLPPKKRESARSFIFTVIEKEFLQSSQPEEQIHIHYGSPRQFVSFVSDILDEEGDFFSWVSPEKVKGYNFHLSIENLREPTLFINEEQYRIIGWENNGFATIANGELVSRQTINELLFGYFALSKEPNESQKSSEDDIHWIQTSDSL